MCQNRFFPYFSVVNPDLRWLHLKNTENYSLGAINIGSRHREVTSRDGFRLGKSGPFFNDIGLRKYANEIEAAIMETN